MNRFIDNDQRCYDLVRDKGLHGDVEVGDDQSSRWHRGVISLQSP
ncbi:MAG: hypothetical protein ACTMIA_12460 [Vibrio sp.]